MADQLFIDSSGEVVPVPSDQVAGAAQLGWVPASPKQVADYQLEQKYGGAGEAAKAFGEHAASAATMGLSDVAERALGVSTPEAMAGREKAHPIASGAGTAAGVVAPLLATMGGSAVESAGPLARAAELSAPSLIAKAGAATTEAVRTALPVGETAIGRIAARAASSGAGSAIEGAAYGLGQVVHEAALGDPDLTAQSALGTIGLSTILAGGLGAGGGFLAEVMPEILPRDLGAKVSSLLETSEGHSNLNATNARPGEIRKVFTAKGEESATKIGLGARDLGIIRNPFTDSPDAIASRATTVKTQAGQEIERIVGEAAGGAERTGFGAIRSDVEGPIAKALKSQGTTFAVGEQFEALLNRFGQAYEGKTLDLNGLWKLKQDIGDFIYRQGKVIDPWAKELNTPLKRVYDHIDGLIERGIKEGSGVEAVTAWNDANRTFEVSSTMERLAQKGIERSAENNAVHLTGQVGTMAGLVAGGPVGGAVMGAASEAVRRRGASALGWAARGLRDAIDGDAVGAVVNKTADAIAAQRHAGDDLIAQAAGSAPEKVATLSLLERLNRSTQTKITTGISAVLRGGVTAGRGEVEAGIASAFGRSPGDARAAFQKRAAQVRQLNNDPALMQGKLQAQTDDWHEHAPNTAQALQVTTARAVAFLASKLPVQGGAGPLAGKGAPGRSEISKFTRYYEAVQHPLSVLKQAAAGTLTPEAVEALQAVYPQLYEQMKATAVAKMAGRSNIPYRQKLMLSMLVGQDLDGSMASAARNFALYASQPAGPMKQLGRGVPKAGKITLANRMLTPSQASAQRKP